jgi:hypothetical protein
MKAVFPPIEKSKSITPAGKFGPLTDRLLVI